MLTLCWGAKRGAGTTLVAAGLTLASASPALLVDLAGDAPLVLGVPEPTSPGVLDWLAASAPTERLAGLEVPLGQHRALMPRGGGTDAPAAGRWRALGEWLAADARHVCVDAGDTPPSELAAAAHARLLVVRNCYLHLRAAAHGAPRWPITGAVLVSEPGRRLGVNDVERAVGAPVVAVVLLDPAIARAGDAGLLLGRLPGGLRAPLAPLAASLPDLVHG